MKKGYTVSVSVRDENYPQVIESVNIYSNGNVWEIQEAAKRQVQQRSYPGVPLHHFYVIGMRPL